MDKKEQFYQRLEQRGVSRRDFMRYCTFLTATMGLSASFVPKVAEVFAAPKQRPPVIWLHFGECTGCSEAMLRTIYPYADELLLEILSVEYHETIMAAAGHQAEEQLHAALEKHTGKFICVVEGSIPTKYNGGYGRIGGRTFLEIAQEVCPQALATICIGSCASFGGIPAAKPNPGGYMGVGQALKMKTINIPGCPPNPINLVGTIVNYLLIGSCRRSTTWGGPCSPMAKPFTINAHAGRILKTRSLSKSSAPRRRLWATAFTRWGAAGRRPTTIARWQNSTTAPVGRWRPGIRASAVANRISGTR